MLRIAIACALLLSGGCLGAAGPDRPGSEAPARRPEALLDEAYAGFRSRQLADVRYRLALDLTAGEARYAGRVEIAFRLLHARAPLTVDFAGGEVRGVSLDGEPVAYAYNGAFLEIPAEALESGARRLRIDYSRAYASDGSGLTRFRDPEDGRVYVHSDFEPYYANRLFPCFDQPDLKARYQLTVDAPADWLVVSALRESSVVEVANGRRWEFPETRPFSTYVFSVAAGPFAVWESRAGDVPLRLLARRSLAPYVDAREWFRVTQQGFGFFQEYFGSAYPFGKYDQLLVPDFLSGAMENVGNVTFSERYVRRGRYTAQEREDLANTILHEMAHMWFGDLVTMRWWNGLWLNESFATYMASLAQARATDVSHAWLSFFTVLEAWAYTSDERVTTHAIDLPVADTDGAFANFDGITYGKGAAVLKQLVHLLGEDAFQRAVQSYLDRHAYGNSELADFIGAMSEASGRDLKKWEREWLYEAGLNSVSAEPTCREGVVERVLLRQASSGGAPLRLHRLRLGAFEADAGGALRATARLPAELHGEQIELAVPGRVPCQAFLYPNEGDWAFVKVRLPDAGNRWLLHRVADFEEPLQRAMLWRALWEAVRDARLPLVDYAEAVLDQLPGEGSYPILGLVLADTEVALAYLQLFGDAYADLHREYAARFEALAWRQLEALSGAPDLQTAWLDFLVASAGTDAGLDRLAGLLEGSVTVPGLVPDQDRRWRMVARLSALGRDERGELARAEARRDPSDKGRKAAIAAAAAEPGLASKREWLARIQTGDASYSLAELQVAMEHLLPPGQVAARRALLAEVLAPLASLDAQRDPSFMEPYVGSLAAGSCEQRSEAALAAALEESSSASVSTTRGLRVALEEEERCLALKELMDAGRPNVAAPPAASGAGWPSVAPR